MPVLTSIWIYPVKGVAGVSLEEAFVEPRGLANDRRWMFVDADGLFLSQRTHPKLALIRARVTPGGVVLEAPGQAPLAVPVPATDERVSVTVWSSTVAALPAGAGASEWASAFLETDCRLVYMPADTIRPVNPAYGRPGDHVSFADGYPALLASEASLADLNSRLAAPVPMNRFRPNLVVDGTEAFAEDGWSRIRIGEVVFRVVKPCDRCVVTTIDQKTGKAGKEPLRTLSRYRKKDGKVYFAQNLIPDAPGTLRRGDPVEVLERKPLLF